MKFFNLLGKTAFLSFLLLAFVFVSCKDDDEETPVTVDDNEIVGRWQLTDVQPENASTSIPALALLPTAAPCYKDLKFTFTSDNKVTLSDCDAAVALVGAFINIAADTKWQVETGKLTLTNGSTSNTFGLTQNPNDMKIIVNTNTSGTGTPVNAVMSLKRL
ncbi:hypothetical protein L0657_18000 [Dyadobacter sp. CY345]|uniref:lipocalin family protein n=1 Tax=Dyadobacter sp. CY345 TaxID=2909335 RepID=UPI001F194EDE|nr:lipocalin family protein [Dyadobacter sp. CY345]MCF2445860.1 hypothetical protein [Dyadobacter sp. CY345]